MAKDLNKAMIIGRLGRDPDVKYAPSGLTIVSMDIATNSSVKNKDTGNYEDATEWHRVTVFGKLAEICEKYLHKGFKVYIEGRLQTRKWEKDGTDHYRTEIIVSDMQMLEDGRREKGVARPSETPRPAQKATYGQKDTYQPDDDMGDDIPF